MVLTITGGTSLTSSGLTYLAGQVVGPSNDNVIASGVITDANVAAGAGIQDSKLATLVSGGKVANSATSATSSANANTIALRDGNAALEAAAFLGSDFDLPAAGAQLSFGLNAANITLGNVGGQLVLNSNMQINSNLQLSHTDAGYNNVLMDGGNSVGAIYANFAQLADGIHLGYNFYYPTGASTPTIPNVSGGTSRLGLGYSEIALAVGAVDQAPSVQLDITPGKIAAQNGAVFSGNLTVPGSTLGLGVNNSTSNVQISSSGLTVVGGSVTGNNLRTLKINLTNVTTTSQLVCNFTAACCVASVCFHYSEAAEPTVEAGSFSFCTGNRQAQSEYYVALTGASKNLTTLTSSPGAFPSVDNAVQVAMSLFQTGNPLNFVITANSMSVSFGTNPGTSNHLNIGFFLYASDAGIDP